MRKTKSIKLKEAKQIYFVFIGKEIIASPKNVTAPFTIRISKPN